ncbi:MAG: primosomal protein N' [Halobacteriovorax sp.]|nr:primosomal protein N' [Halobacteriovorax sp.]|tara:strand:- start:301070 stop:303052 length:1983 start_codon:yes stop_codon:yes gene_type:complete
MAKHFLVAVNTPFNNSLLTYKSEVEFLKGDLVEIPLGKRITFGCVINEISGDLDTDIEYKKIRGLVDDSINISGEIDFLSWISKYYHYPLGQLIFDTLPKVLKRPRELKFFEGENSIPEVVLENEQELAWEELDKLNIRSFSKKLIHGITGSGKSYIYLKFIKKVLNENRRVLFLVPEINLTPQFISFFVQHLKVPIYLYHSDISNSDKYNLWKLMQEDAGPCLIIGVRSSIFIPIKNLGCIVVDEEHDNSFKQDDRCPYSARDAALKKAQLNNIPILLGSATPGMDSFYNFKKTDDYIPITKRFSKGSLPEIDLVDLRETDYGIDFETWPIPVSTLEKVKQRLEAGEQVLFFINKLGFASYVQCRSCGHTFDCPNCSVSLTMFKGRRELSCHSCTYKEEMPSMCPMCQNMNLLNKGFGTEKVSEVLEEYFGDKSIARFDRDEIKTTKKLEEVLNSFHSRRIDILVGTQMVSKGHNFKNVNLVVVLGIDSQMNYPDYRANERAYQLLTQISGRSGRFGKSSSVMVHTHNPENDIFSFVKAHSFDGFYQKEIEIREVCSCPPFFKLVAIYINGKDRDVLVGLANKLTSELSFLSEKYFNEVGVLGPRPTVIEKRANKYTWVTLLKSSDINQLHNLLSTWEEKIKLKSGYSIKIDVDPTFIT